MEVMSVPWVITVHLGHRPNISIHVQLDLSTLIFEWQKPKTACPALQVHSVPSLDRVLHQACVVLDTTASLGPSHPHHSMEDRQETGVLRVTTVHKAHQHQYPVLLDIIAIALGMQISPTAYLVFLVFFVPLEASLSLLKSVQLVHIVQA